MGGGGGADGARGLRLGVRRTGEPTYRNRYTKCDEYEQHDFDHYRYFDHDRDFVGHGISVGDEFGIAFGDAYADRHSHCNAIAHSVADA